jgi:DNA mismatch repair protein MutS
MKGEQFLTTYFTFQRNMIEQFGSRSVLLMQKGKFYEIYSLPDQESFNLFSNVCDVLNIQMSRCNKNKPLASDNPHMAGFQKDALQRRLKTLLEAGFTIQIVDEEKNGTKNISRSVCRTVTNTTMIEDGFSDNEIKWIGYCVVLEKQMSLCFLNLQLGSIVIYPDQTFDIEELIDLLHKHSIGEIIVKVSSNNTQTQSTISSTLRSMFNNVPIKVEETADIGIKVSLKEQMLRQVFKETIGSSVIEKLGLEKFDLASSNLVHLLNYAMKFDPTLVRRMHTPQIVLDDHTLYLPENAIDQLDLLSVCKEIDHTVTPMGKRLFKYKIFHPASVSKQIKYVLLEMRREDRTKMRQIGDLEKIWTRILSSKATENDFIRLYHSYQIIEQVLEKYCRISSSSSITVSAVTMNNLSKALKYLHKRLYLEEKEREQTTQFFKSGVSLELDNCLEEKKRKEELLNTLRMHIHHKIFQTDKYVLCCSSTVKKEIRNDLGVTFKKCAKGYQLWTKETLQVAEALTSLTESFESLYRQAFITFCKEFSDLFTDAFYILMKKVAELDLAQACQVLVNEYGYSIPTFHSSSSSQSDLVIEQLVHPIHSGLRTAFVPQDITLSNGMLLFGVNFAGKTTMLRIVGIAVILAQAGLPVPCSKMIFTPFTRLYSKICLGDNYKKNQSTFTNEVYEIKKMITKSDDKTLILADELCSGTEINSAIALVASCISCLSEKNVKFIFTTHYHPLLQIEEVRQSSIEIYHMETKQEKLQTNEGVDALEYTFVRRLKKGEPQDDIYGIEIAMHMELNSSFIKKASEIRSRLMKRDFLVKKTSRYNSNVLVKECQICKEREGLHTHHIRFQKDFRIGDKRTHYHTNLVVLCEECHHKVHQGLLTLDDGYVQTSSGVKLMAMSDD